MLVISADGKGIVMRPEALRPQTARKAQAATTKLKTRLPKGENAIASASPKSAPSTTSRPSPDAPPT